MSPDRHLRHLNWIDHSAVSVGEMVYRLALAAGAKLTPEMATCLYTTLLTDTGGFCYGAVRESTFALARELVAAGADPVAIAHEVYFSVLAVEASAAGRGAAQVEARRETGLAMGHAPGHGAELRRGRGLRRHREYCAGHCRR